MVEPDLGTPPTVRRDRRRSCCRRSRRLRVLQLTLTGRRALMSLTMTVPDRGAVRLPQLRAVDAVVGGEEQPASRTRSGPRARTVAGTGMDVLDQDGARPAAVRLPQLLAVGAVVWR